MAAPRVHVIPVDPYDPRTGLLVPEVTQRILDFARQNFEEMDAQVFTRGVMTSLWAQNPRVRVVALVEAESLKIVGHGVATLEDDGAGRSRVFVSQMKADGNVGDAVARAIKLADEWAASVKAENMVMSTTRSDSAWTRKYGFKVMRHLMVRKVGTPIREGGEA